MHFWPQIWTYFLLSKIFKSDKFDGADFITTEIGYFWYQIKGFLVLHQTLQQDKFTDADFKYGNNFFKFQSKNNHRRQLWFQIQTLSFLQNFEIRQLRGAYFKYNNTFFIFQSENALIRPFCSQIQPFLLFFFKLAIRQIRGW